MLLRYPELHEVTRSRIGIPASARAKVAALIHADLVPAENKFPAHVHLNTYSTGIMYSDS